MMGLKKNHPKIRNGWGELYPIFLDFLNFFNVAKPLNNHEDDILLIVVSNVQK